MQLTICNSFQEAVRLMRIRSVATPTFFVVVNDHLWSWCSVETWQTPKAPQRHYSHSYITYTLLFYGSRRVWSLCTWRRFDGDTTSVVDQKTRRSENNKNKNTAKSYRHRHAVHSRYWVKPYCFNCVAENQILWHHTHIKIHIIYCTTKLCALNKLIQLQLNSEVKCEHTNCQVIPAPVMACGAGNLSIY